MKNKSPLTFCTFLVACCLTLFTISNISAQENGIYELNDNNVVSRAKVKKHKDNNRSKFYNLAQKLHTTAYIKNNTVNKVYGEGEIKKITFSDSKSFNLLNKKNYSSLELITIKINKVNDLNNILDLTTNEKLNKLKYVFIKCDFKCTKKQIKTFIKVKKDSKIRIFYRTKSAS